MTKKNPDSETSLQPEAEKTDTETAKAQVAAPVVQAAAPAVPEVNRSGFYCYIGPNIKGTIQTGKIYRGSREAALRMAAAAIEKYPLVKNLIVSGDALSAARTKVKQSGSALYAIYQKLAGK